MGMVRGWLPSIKNGDSFLFVIGMAILYYFYKYDKQYLGNISSILSVLLGDNNNTNSNNTPSKESSSTISSSPKDPRSFNLWAKTTLLGMLRGFTIGLVVKGGLGFLSGLTKGHLLKNPWRYLRQNVLGRSTLRFALFLSFLVGGLKGIPSILHKIRRKEDPLHMVITGAVAGSAIALSKNSEISMYFFSKAAEAIFRFLVAKKYVKTMKYGEELLFAVGTGFLFYCSVLEPYTLRPSYWKFLWAMSAGRYAQFELVARYSPYFFCF
jgi:hypothetical protein